MRSRSNSARAPNARASSRPGRPALAPLSVSVKIFSAACLGELVIFPPFSYCASGREPEKGRGEVSKTTEFVEERHVLLICFLYIKRFMYREPVSFVYYGLNKPAVCRGSMTNEVTHIR